MKKEKVKLLKTENIRKNDMSSAAEQAKRGITFSEKEIREECGVFGVISEKPADAAALTYYGLYALQHRGQESCGIVVNDDGVFVSHKDPGLVSEVFSAQTLASFPEASMAVGHVRYGTTGRNNRNNCQPIEVNHQKGRMAIAHNGNLTNAMELRTELELSGAIFHTTSDTETIAYIVTRERLTSRSIEEAVCRAMDRLQGAYSLILMSPQKLICVRDPHGFRPLCYGKTEDGSYVIASETCALSAAGAEYIRDVEPGEILVFGRQTLKCLDEERADTAKCLSSLDCAGIAEKNNNKSPAGSTAQESSTEQNSLVCQGIKKHCGTCGRKICIFEYIYFSRPDSVIDGISVHEARLQAGRILAEEYPAKADMVIGVPDSGLDAALGFAQKSGIPYGIGLIRNKYTGRTFIAPEQSSRAAQVNIKLSVIKETVKNKRIILVDDSIVRGTTSERIVRQLKDAGAKEIHMRISSPHFLHPCYYGTDIDSEEQLIANHHTDEEIAKIIGADSLGFLPVEQLWKLTGSREYCAACFDGNYPTQVPVDARKEKFEQKLSELRTEGLNNEQRN